MRTFIASAITASFLLVAPAGAEVAGLDAGQVAPAGGVWVSDDSALRLARDVDAGLRAIAELAAARALLAEHVAHGTAMVGEIDALKAQVAVLEKRVALAEKLDAVRVQVDDITTKALAVAAASLDLQVKLDEATVRVVDLNVKVLEQQNEALKVANAEIARLREHGFWESLKVVLFGVGAFFAGKVF